MLSLRRFPKAIPIGLLPLLLAVVFMGTASTPLGGKPVDISQIGLSDVQEQVATDLYDSSGKIINPDRELQSVSRSNGGGYGGFYLDGNTAYVYMTDVTNIEAAEAAFRASYNGDRTVSQIVPVQGSYTLDQLVDWFYSVDRGLGDVGIVSSMGGMRPAKNAFMIAVREQSLVDDAWGVIDHLNVPRGAVILEVDYPIKLTGYS